MPSRTSSTKRTAAEPSSVAPSTLSAGPSSSERGGPAGASSEPAGPGVSPGVLDWAVFEARLRALPEGQPVSVALMDIDHFLDVNERHGREVGDRLLRRLERALLGSLPAESFVARLGGDEYAAALPEHPVEGALIVMEEIRRHLAGSGAVERGSADAISLSVGLAAYPAHAALREAVPRLADEALARAKREGRGRCAIYVESRMVLKSNYYPKASLARLTKLADALDRTEASLLREALDDLIERYRETV
jgi:diguanylate cyclase (GGDEF)-like protein